MRKPRRGARDFESQMPSEFGEFESGVRLNDQHGPQALPQQLQQQAQLQQQLQHQQQQHRQQHQHQQQAMHGVQASDRPQHLGQAAASEMPAAAGSPLPLGRTSSVPPQQKPTLLSRCRSSSVPVVVVVALTASVVVRSRAWLLWARAVVGGARGRCPQECV